MFEIIILVAICIWITFPSYIIISTWRSKTKEAKNKKKSLNKELERCVCLKQAIRWRQGKCLPNKGEFCVGCPRKDECWDECLKEIQKELVSIKNSFVSSDKNLLHTPCNSSKDMV